MGDKVRIAMTGATGFVGTRLAVQLATAGHTVVPIGRGGLEKQEDIVRHLHGADVVINLAGAPVLSHWTEQYKRTLRASRIDVTRRLVDAMSCCDPKPGLFISTSAIGIYSTEGVHTEDNCRYASDFLGTLAADWEAEAMRAEALGIRTAIFRMGIVLGMSGGALKNMILPFSLFLGGTIGDGRQPMSWIHIADLIRAYGAVMDDAGMRGVYNLVSPNPTTNREFTKALGRALHRPSFMRVPGFALRYALGDGADVLVKGQLVLPARLLDAGFSFGFNNIEDAIRDCVA